MAVIAEQCRGARAMLGLTRHGLAELADVAPSTLAEFESKRRPPLPRTLTAIRRALEEAGVEFFADDNGGRPGVRLAGRTNPP